jgi:hypothetical protein
MQILFSNQTSMEFHLHHQLPFPLNLSQDLRTWFTVGLVLVFIIGLMLRGIDYGKTKVESIRERKKEKKKERERERE